MCDQPPVQSGINDGKAAAEVGAAHAVEKRPLNRSDRNAKLHPTSITANYMAFCEANELFSVGACAYGDMQRSEQRIGHLKPVGECGGKRAEHPARPYLSEGAHGVNVALASRQLLEICQACKASGQWRGEQSRSFATVAGVEKGRRRRREEPLKPLRIIQALLYLLVVSLVHGPPIRLAWVPEQRPSADRRQPSFRGARLFGGNPYGFPPNFLLTRPYGIQRAENLTVFPEVLTNI